MLFTVTVGPHSTQIEADDPYSALNAGVMDLFKSEHGPAQIKPTAGGIRATEQANSLRGTGWVMIPNQATDGDPLVVTVEPA